MRSIDLFNEYVEKHSQRAMYEFLGVSQTTVSEWKRRGGMTAAATVQIGVELGYDVDLCTQIALIEAERSERGKKSLWEIFAKRAGATAMVALAVGTAGVATELKAQEVARPAGIEPATPAFGGQDFQFHAVTRRPIYHSN
ncbi:helix-turn-helix domain-containing protein [Cupriavidus sp. HMR-1]|uniref:hypothetical protein n=1 Tax=Cupriavidus sp. HMR-1 TaxID=1249621 RepID=UPI0002A1EE45|nr:hypothetical protein [Cupriavidus sp. HMR-1]EKZ97630.1 helix-turn-helix domain-containing protein [Cupriavidus sp. HMR-1]